MPPSSAAGNMRETAEGEAAAVVDEKKLAVRKAHQVVLRNRESLAVEGVVNLESFDDQEVVLETDSGVLLVRGDDLHVKGLNLETGSLVVEGFVKAIEYSGETPARKGKGLMGRLFR